MGSGKADAQTVAGYHAEYRRAFQYFKSSVFEEIQSLVSVGNGRGIDNQCRVGVAKIFGNFRYFIGVGDYSAFGYKGVGKCGLGAVISGDTASARKKLSHKCSHAYTSGSYKIYVVFSLVHSQVI